MLSTKRPPCHASGIEVQPYGTPRQPEGPAQALDPRLKEKGHKGSKGTAACTPAVLSTQQFHPSMATSVGKSVVAWPAPAMTSGAAAQPTPTEAAVVVPVAWPEPAAGVGAIAWPTPSASAGPRASAPGAPQLAGQTTEQPRIP